MLAALSHHIGKLEQKLDAQSREIENLRMRDSICDCMPDISSLRAQVNENRCRIDSIVVRIERGGCHIGKNGGGSYSSKLHHGASEAKVDILKPPSSFQMDDRLVMLRGGRCIFTLPDGRMLIDHVR